MGNVGLWHALATSNIIEDFNRKPIDFTNEGLGGERSGLPETLFKAASCEVTAPNLDDITDPKKIEGPSFSGRSKDVIPCAVSCVISIHESNAWNKTVDAWQSLLPRVGDVIRMVGSSEFLMVMHTFPWGCLTVPTVAQACGLSTSVIVHPEKESRGAWKVIDDYKKWVAYPVTACPPTYATKRKGIVELHMPKNGVPILDRCILTGLKGMTDVYLARLIDLLAPVGFRKSDIPKTVTGKVIMIIKLAFPKMTPEEIQAIVSLRHALEGHPSKPICSETDVANTVMDPDDFDKVKETTAAAKDSSIKRQQTDELIKPGSKYIEDLKEIAEKTNTALAHASKKKTIDVSKVPSVKEMKKFLPQVKGCNIEWIKMKSSWTVFYPGAKPASRTRTYGKLCTQLAVKKHVLRWAWNEHAKAKPAERCPFDFT